MQGERREPVAEPDKQIVQKCVAALKGHSVRELRMLLRSRFRNGRRPGTEGGPRSYAWFVRVIENAFGPNR